MILFTIFYFCMIKEDNNKMTCNKTAIFENLFQHLDAFDLGVLMYLPLCHYAEGIGTRPLIVIGIRDLRKWMPDSQSSGNFTSDSS